MTIKTTLQQLMGGTTPIIEGHEVRSPPPPPPAASTAAPASTAPGAAPSLGSNTKDLMDKHNYLLQIL
jgi:hypothetical protein